MRRHPDKVQLVGRAVGDVGRNLDLRIDARKTDNLPIVDLAARVILDAHVGLKTHLLHDAVAHRDVDGLFVNVPRKLALIRVPRNFGQRQFRRAPRAGGVHLLRIDGERPSQLGKVRLTVLCWRHREVGNGNTAAHRRPSGCRS